MRHNPEQYANSVAGKETRGDFLQMVGNQQGACFRRKCRGRLEVKLMKLTVVNSC